MAYLGPTSNVLFCINCGGAVEKCYTEPECCVSPDNVAHIPGGEHYCVSGVQDQVATLARNCGNRPSWDEYFLNIAKAVAARADCTRRKVGAVITKDHRIVAAGYNGAPAGKPGCSTCPRSQHYKVPPHDYFGEDGYCVCGTKWPCPSTVEPGSQYDSGNGKCVAIHAEANALLYADYDKCLGATLYITDEPCEGCYKLVEAAGVDKVVWQAGDATWKIATVQIS